MGGHPRRRKVIVSLLAALALGYWAFAVFTGVGSISFIPPFPPFWLVLSLWPIYLAAVLLFFAAVYGIMTLLGR